MRRGGDAAALGDRLRRVLGAEVALGQQLEDRLGLRPSGRVKSPTIAGEQVGRIGIASRRALRSQASGAPFSSRANSPSSAPPGLRTTSQGALV